MNFSEKHYKNELRLNGKVIHLDVWYPRNNEADTIEVGLMDVRAADNIRIQYDFERDGWVIKQASIFQWESHDKICDSDWQEVAFVQAWGRQKPTNEVSE